MKNDKINTDIECSRCEKIVGGHEICIIDDLPVCLSCIYGGLKPFEIYPIGTVKNDLKRADTGFGTIGEKGISSIELLESQLPFLYKLEEEKKITVVYYLHETKNVKSVFNRGLDGKKVGIFASRTPYRLSKIAIQDVELVNIEQTTLYVRGLDAINGTPVLDIKMKKNGFF